MICKSKLIKKGKQKHVTVWTVWMERENVQKIDGDPNVYRGLEMNWGSLWVVMFPKQFPIKTKLLT